MCCIISKLRYLTYTRIVRQTLSRGSWSVAPPCRLVGASQALPSFVGACSLFRLRLFHEFAYCVNSQCVLDSPEIWRCVKIDGRLISTYCVTFD